MPFVTVGHHPDLFEPAPTPVMVPWAELNRAQRFDFAMMNGIDAVAEAVEAHYRETGDVGEGEDVDDDVLSDVRYDVEQYVDHTLLPGSPPAKRGQKHQRPSRYKGYPLWFDQAAFVGQRRSINPSDRWALWDYRDAPRGSLGDRLEGAWDDLAGTDTDVLATCVYVLLAEDTEPTPDNLHALGAVLQSDAELREAAEALPPGRYKAHVCFYAVVPDHENLDAVPITAKPLDTVNVIVE